MGNRSRRTASKKADGAGTGPAAAKDRDILATVAEWVWETDTVFRISYISDSFPATNGFDPDKLIGHTWTELGFAAGNADDELAIAAALAAREPFRGIDTVGTLPDGRRLWSRVSGYPVFDADGRFTGYRGTRTDDTELHETQQALHESQQRFDDFAESASEWFWEMGPDLRITYMSDDMVRHTGLDTAWHIGSARREPVGSTDEEQAWSRHLDDLANGRPFRGFEFCHRRMDGSLQWFSISGKPLFADDGEFLGYRGVASDVTETKLATLRNRELAAIVERSDDVVITVAHDGTIISWNEAAERIYGYTANQAIGRHIDIVVGDVRLARQQSKMLERVLGGDAVRDVVTERTGKDGARLIVSLTMSPIRDAHGRVVAAASVARNITPMREIEAALRDSNQHLQAVLSAITEGIITIDERGVITLANPAAQALFGYGADELIGRKVKMLMPEKGVRYHNRYLNKLLRVTNSPVASVRREIEARRADGTTFAAEVAVGEFTTEGQRMLAGVVRDISEQKRAEASLRAANERLKAVFATVADGIITIDHLGRIQSANPAVERLFGYSQRRLIGKNIAMLMPEEVARQHDRFIDGYLQTGEAKIVGIGRDVEGRHADGTTFPLELAVTEFTVDGKRMFAGVLRDISEHKRPQVRSHELAVSDPLTGAFNRRYLEVEALAALKRARHMRKPVSLILLDGDGFKAIDDTHGHQAGDEILKAIVDVCRSAVRDVDVVARMDGEEFAILLPDTAMNGARLTAERVRRRMAARTTRWQHAEMTITLSLGVATAADGSGPLGALLAAADRALYAAKANGRNRTVLADTPPDAQDDMLAEV